MSSINPTPDYNNTSQSESTEETSETPPPPPPDNRFQKYLKRGNANPPSKEDMEQMANEEIANDKPPSLFDLSKKGSKAKSPFFTQEGKFEKSMFETRAQNLNKKQSSRNAGNTSENPSGFEEGEVSEQGAVSVLGNPEGEGVQKSPEEQKALGKGIQQNEATQKNQVLDANLKQTQLQDQANRQGVQRSAETSSEKVRGSDRESMKKDKMKTSKETSSPAENQSALEGGEGVNASIKGVGLGLEQGTTDESMQSGNSSNIQDLANQMIENIQILERSDRTETTVTLRHPPILEGATITLTAFASAKGEYNVAFGNLSQQGKAFLDQKMTERSLNDQLDRKGIVVHIVTTSTQPHVPMYSDQSQQSREQQQQRQGQEKEQEQEKDNKRKR